MKITVKLNDSCQYVDADYVVKNRGIYAVKDADWYVISDLCAIYVTTRSVGLFRPSGYNGCKFYKVDATITLST